MMAKRLKHSKKHKCKWIFKLGLLVAVCYLSFECTTYYILKSKLATTNEEFLNQMLRDSNHYLLYEKSEKNIISKMGKFLMDIDFSKPDTLLSMKQFSKSNKPEKTQVVYQEEEPKETGYIKNPVTEKNTEKTPRVYIYNSHQGENYSMKTLEPYNITPSVMMASYLLREHLNKAGIPTIVEETNINEYMKTKGWNHARSYDASREFVANTLKKYPDLELIIDLHRDALPHDTSTITIGEKNYAKVLFIIGLNNKAYESNLSLATTISDKINGKFPKLSRGIMKKQGATVNGRYNQDLNPNMILMEVGANENTIDEVQNTIEAIANIITEKLNGQ